MLTPVGAAIKAALTSHVVIPPVIPHYRQYAPSLPLEYMAGWLKWLATDLVRFAISDAVFVGIVTIFFYAIVSSGRPVSQREKGSK